jgi:hypothetical protein
MRNALYVIGAGLVVVGIAFLAVPDACAPGAYPAHPHRSSINPHYRPEPYYRLRDDMPELFV